MYLRMVPTNKQSLLWDHWQTNHYLVWKNDCQIRENLAVSTQYWTNGQNDSNQWLAFNKEVRGNVPNSQKAKAKVPGVQQR